MKKKLSAAILLILLIPVLLNPEGGLNTALRLYLSMYGIEFQQVQTENYSIGCYYGDGGHDETILFLHGLGGKAASSWFTVLPQLSENFNVLAPDLLLANLVEGGDTEYSLEQDVQLISQLLEKKGITKVAIVGLSVGGWIASLMAVENPRLCSKLVLVDSAGVDTKDLLELVASKENGFGKWFYENIFYPGPPVPSFLVGPIIKDMDKLGPLCNEFLKKNIYAGQDLETGLDKIKCPVMIVWGAEDRVIPLKSAYKFRELISDSCLVVLNDCGHAVVWDGRREIPDLIDKFLEGSPVDCLETDI